MTAAEAIARGRDALLRGGIPPEEATGDAEVLARHVLGWDLTQLALSRRSVTPSSFQEQYDAAIARRLGREPVSQILGRREFWGLDFEVTRDVLTPRPETECLVHAALDAYRNREWPTDYRPIIVDVGTGSGCIAIALAIELPDARFIASDVSLDALTVARRNAARHGVSNRIAFLHTSRVPPENDFDIVVSNPPYIPESQRESLAPEVRLFEPDEALYGGEDGLEFYRELLSERVHGDFSQQGQGRLIVEVGYDQAPAVKALADPRYWTLERGYNDLQGFERVLRYRAESRNRDQRQDEWR